MLSTRLLSNVSQIDGCSAGLHADVVFAMSVFHVGRLPYPPDISISAF